MDKDYVIPQLHKCIRNFTCLLEDIKSLNLISLNKNKLKSIEKPYELLCNVKGLGPTGISKYLHMHKPNLFIMWDNQIFRDYFHIYTVNKYTASSKRYIKFMLRMKDEILEAISTWNLSENLSENNIINLFKQQFNNETIPRILDKYNFVTRGKKKTNIY